VLHEPHRKLMGLFEVDELMKVYQEEASVDVKVLVLSNHSNKIRVILGVINIVRRWN
jgi:hypothetical protein